MNKQVKFVVVVEITPYYGESKENQSICLLSTGIY
jgi:hypothetical protein